MRHLGWAVDTCEGMLEMLRLLDRNDYEILILNLSQRNVEIQTRLGAIKALNKNPKILLNLIESEDVLSSSLILEYPVIKGRLTPEKFLNAVQNIAHKPRGFF